MKKRVSVIYKLSDADFIDLVKKSGSLCDIVKYFGLSINGSGGFVTVKRRIEELSIDCSHIAKRIKERRQNNFILNQPMPLNNILVDNSTYTNTHNLKHRLIKDKILTNHCYICKIDSWNGKHLSLQIDHINGHKRDNRIENLRLLCPNCHSQTLTYAGKKNEQIRAKHYCSVCNKEITADSKSGLCPKCSLEITNSKNRIGQVAFCKEDKIFNSKSGQEIDFKNLEQEIKELGWEATGRKYCVSGTTIKNWAQKYGLDIVSQKEFKLSISSSVCADFKDNRMSLRELSKKYKTSIDTIRGILIDSGLKEKNPEKKYKHGGPGIYFDASRNDYSCYIRVDKKDKFLKRGFHTAEEASIYRNNFVEGKIV